MDIIERLRFDATRCETQFSKGVATNIEDGIAEIERLRAARDAAIRSLSDDRLPLASRVNDARSILAHA